MFIAEAFAKEEPVTYVDIQDFINEQFDIVLLPDTIRHLVRKNPHLKTVHGLPMDQSRLQSSPEDIDLYFELISKDFQGVPSSFIFNLDETGFDDWADKAECCAVVPATFPDAEILVPVSRQTKRATLLGCIAADGSSLKPFVIVPRRTMEREIILNGYTSEKVTIVHQPNGFIDSKLFEDWADSIFFPEVQRRREVSGYYGMACLILDGCTCHATDWFLEECLFRNISVTFLAAHSSDQTQPLDLGIFSVAKAAQQRCRPSMELGQQTKQILKLLYGWHAAVTPPNIIGAFREGGIISELQNGVLVAKVDTRYARRVRHFPRIANLANPTVDTSRLPLD